MLILSNYNQSERRLWVAEQAIAIPAGSHVLDAGAGIGQYRSLFAHCVYKTQDFGQEPGTVGKYTQLDYESDITSIPVDDSTFDVVLCTEVLEHVPEPIQTVKELARILRPGGKLLVSAPLASFLHQEPYHFYGGYTPWWYRKFLPQTGLEVISIEPNQGFFSWFGQESQRFSALIDPRRTTRTGWRWPLLTLFWLLTLPFCRLLFPLLGRPLDALELEHYATVGYHIVAVKQRNVG